MSHFDSYPGAGRELLGKCSGGNCRHEYGLKLQRLTGQTACAYCELSLVDTYEHWLLMSVDHVIPTRTGLALGISADWLADYCNTVLCCWACNGFGNRYQLAAETIVPTDFAAFVKLRDETFALRKTLILGCHPKERQFYDSLPWERGSVATVVTSDQAVNGGQPT
jgi:hypothetical protein